MSGECVASVKMLHIKESWKLRTMLFTFQESLPIPHVLLLGKALYKSKVWCPSSNIIFVQKIAAKRSMFFSCCHQNYNKL
jgi:hypothetical protein